MGVTTGQLLCACVGSPDRAEYTVYGDAINLSARLMMKASNGLGSVLCDATTQEFASRAATFTKLKPMKASILHMCLHDPACRHALGCMSQPAKCVMCMLMAAPA